MLRRSFWLIFALLPLLAALAIYELHDVAVWRSLLSAGVPVAIVDGLRNEWWWIFVGLVVAHYALFTLLPFVPMSRPGGVSRGDDPQWHREHR